METATFQGLNVPTCLRQSQHAQICNCRKLCEFESNQRYGQIWLYDVVCFCDLRRFHVFPSFSFSLCMSDAGDGHSSTKSQRRASHTTGAEANTASLHHVSCFASTASELFLSVGFDGRRNVPTAKSLDADVGSAELPDLFDSLIIAPAATPKLDMDLSEGRWSRLLLGTFGIRDIR